MINNATDVESSNYNPLSLSSYFVYARFNDRSLSSATAFFIKQNSDFFLITNWHVVSGRNAQTNECLDKDCAIPNNLLIRLHKDSDFIEFEDYEINLTNEFGVHLWLEHPEHGRNVDVVAIKVNLPSHLLVENIEKSIEPMNENTKEVIADDVFIIGYPFGLSVGDIFPIWKRASIASEPNVDIHNLPLMYVDTASRSGMSGSPVVLFERRSTTLLKKESENSDVFLVSRHKMKLVGIYSGRIGVEDTLFQAQLGVVWKSRVIDEIIHGISNEK
jgi:Trypsin-like peptidase domain